MKQHVVQYHKCKCQIVNVLLNILPPSNRRIIKHSSLESSYQDKSNGNNFIFLRLLDGKIINDCNFNHVKPLKTSKMIVHFGFSYKTDHIGLCRTE